MKKLKRITEEFHNQFVGLHNSTYKELRNSKIGMMFMYAMSDKKAKANFEETYPNLKVINVKMMNVIVAENIMYAVYFKKN